MKNLYKLAEILNKKYNLSKLASSDVQDLVNVMVRYESRSEFLGVFIQALDSYAEQTIKDLDPINDALDIEEIQKQMSLIEAAINSIINQVAELDEAWSTRQQDWLNDYKANK
jgi:hypothetical protein